MAEHAIPELTTALVALLSETKDEHGWEGVTHVLEMAILQLCVADWAGKAPGSIGRLKRLRQALRPAR